MTTKLLQFGEDLEHLKATMTEDEIAEELDGYFAEIANAIAERRKENPDGHDYKNNPKEYPVANCSIPFLRNGAQGSEYTGMYYRFMGQVAKSANKANLAVVSTFTCMMGAKPGSSEIETEGTHLPTLLVCVAEKPDFDLDPRWQELDPKTRIPHMIEVFVTHASNEVQGRGNPGGDLARLLREAMGGKG